MLRETILGYITIKDLDGLKEMLNNAEAIEILYAFNDLSDEDQVIVFRLLSKNAALELFEQLDTDHQQNLIRAFKHEGIIEYVNEMAPDDRVRLLDELPATVAKKLLDSLSPVERRATNVLMGYQPETAGRVMTTEYITLRRDMSVNQALEQVRAQAKDKETIYTMYIADRSRKLDGVVSLKELIVADGESKLEDVMTHHVIKVTTDTDQEDVANLLKEMDFLTIPVVDKEDRLLGIVTIDDAIDILEEEATEDIYDQAGFADITGNEADRAEVLSHGTIWQIWKVRLPFLMITLVAGMISGSVIGAFEEVLEAVVVVAFFIPMIMDMGGSVGTQSSTVFVRGVALGHINVKQFWNHLFKEIFIGFSIGAVVGTLAGILAFVWRGMPMLGLSVGLAMMATSTLAATLGFFVPYLLIRFKLDQAAGSTPIITSIKDIAGLLIYFGFASIFLHNLIY